MDRRGFVRDLEQSWSANHIGISTLAFTTDLQVVLVQQSDGNVSERGRVAPSGSGSAEPRDCLQNIEPLTDVLGRAMERELREECNLDGVPMRTKVLGYSRWIDHGAMPEFYGVTALGVDERAMLDLKVSRSERLLIGRIRTAGLDLRDLRNAAMSDDLVALDAMVDGAVSTPLTMCLRALGTALNDDPALLEGLVAEIRN